MCVEGNLQALDDQINRIERSDKDGERSCSDSVFESESMSEQSVITIRQDTSCAVSVPNGEVEKEDSTSQIKAVDRRLDSIDDKESGYYSKLQIDDLDRSQTVRDSVNSWLDRYHVPMTREPSKAYEYKVIEEDFSLPNRTYIDHLTTYIPPRLPIEKPDLYTMTPETATLSWKPAKVPDRIRNTCNLTYSIEVRNPPGLDWRELVSGLTSTNYDLKNLHPRLDYLFRIRAHNEYGCSEPCLPVSLHRPIELSDDEFDIEDWDDPYRISLGQLAPPKLPMEAPRITDNGVTAHLSWLAARIPAYAKKTPITYIVEIKEPNIPGWSRVSSGITDTNYFVEDLLQNKDYQFRVKAETQFGVSDPTLPVSLERSKIPPRMPSSRPLICHRHGNSISLSWNPGRVPSYVKNSKMTYVVEIREPPSPLWRVLADNLTDNDFDINNLEPDQDYMFRVRAKNDFGLSEPTLPASVFREKDDYTPPTLSRSRSGSASPWVGGSRASSVDRQRSFSLTDDDLDIYVNRDRKPCPPEFKTPVETTQYGVEGRAAKLILPLRGYPLPRVSWFYMGERLECGDLFKASVSPAGMANLDIQRMSQERVGDYKCCVENEHGVAVKIVRLLLADQPTVIEPMKNLSLGMRGSGKFECRVDGTPYPTVKFLKDMRPVVGSSRVKIDHTPPDLWTLTIDGAMSMDAGTYTCIAENMAGKVSSVARINVAGRVITSEKIIDNFDSALLRKNFYILFHVLEGRHGVVRRVVDKITGGEYAAKFIPVADDRQRQFFMHELRNLRSIEHKGVPPFIIFDLDLFSITGGNILSYVIRRKNQIEEDVAYYTEQLLLILKYLHGNNILHLDIKPSSVHFIEEGSDNICLLDFGFSRNFSKGKDVRLNFGSVDFTSPEQIANDRVSPATDLWNVGLLVHTLLSGESPFHDKTEADSLRRIQECDWSFAEDYFDGISTEARDFIKKLLLKEPSERMSLADCLSHPFIKGDCEDGQGQKLNTERLRAYSKTLRERKSKHLLQTTANLVSLQMILDNKDVAQPVLRGQNEEGGGVTYPDSSAYGEFLDDESWFDWQSRSFGGDEDLDAQTDSHPVWRDPSVLKEEEWSSVAEDYKQQIQKPQDFFPKEEMDADNPQFLTKLGNLLFRPGEDITLTCRVATGDSLTVSWYRNEELMSESNRVKVTMSDGGEASLVVCGAKPYDDGLYKCVVRSKTGKSSTWARVLVGELPSQPYRPIITQVSSRDALLLWESPITDADMDIKRYRVDYKEKGTEEWLIGGYTVDQMALVSGLMADSTYQFRVCATNTIGSGPYSVSSLPTKTLKDNSEEIELEPLETILLSKQNPQAHETVTCDYEPKELTLKEENIENTYNLSETFYRGQFSEFSLAKEAVTNKYFVSKQIIQSDSNKDTIQRELEILRLNQSNQRILRLLDCFIYNSNIYFIHEYFCGVNIVEHFAFKTKYSEDMVAIAIQQVLDGVQFLHQNNIVHLNLQPSSIVMRRRSSLDVRITDFTLAQTVDSKEGLAVPVNGNPEFLAPEVVVQEKVSYPADIWTLGDLTFLLLSGESPYYGRKKDVTLSNIAYNRYYPLALYENITRDALRFIFKVLKRTPRNRMTVDACLEDRWLQGKDSIVKARQEAIFTTVKLRTYIERTLTDADEDALPTLKELRTVFELTEDKRHRFSVPERSFDAEELEKKETKITSKGDEGSVDKDKPEVATDQPESKEIIDTGGEVKDSTETDDKTDDKDDDKDDGTSQTSSDRIEQVADDLVATAVKNALHSGEISTKGVEEA
ncbi:hypothetical protein FSP39_007890 [Pinctada imbricata]|uniref:Obscurin n=1 Tax=Pinctada imbricata TaxID=66713 RepID=A0AA88XCN6_PINIB|nr:hypothetical protein FSP39_007890 [Pinctada imbricata]